MQERRTPYPADLFAGDAIVISARVASQISFFPPEEMEAAVKSTCLCDRTGKLIFTTGS
jgi:hypothetical protein